MSSTAYTSGNVGKGAIVGYSAATDAGPYTYIPLALAVSVSPNLTMGETENMTLASTFKPYLPTVAEAEADLTIQHAMGDPGTIAVIAAVGSGQILHWEIKTPDNSTCHFDGFLKGYQPSFENEEVVEADCSIRMTTLPVFTAGSSS